MAVVGAAVGFSVGRGTAWEVEAVRVPFFGADCLVRVNRLTGEQRLVTDSPLCRTMVGDSRPSLAQPLAPTPASTAAPPTVAAKMGEAECRQVARRLAAHQPVNITDEVLCMEFADRPWWPRVSPAPMAVETP